VTLVNSSADFERTEPIALYVHWPFCVSKCPYCDFNSHVRERIDQDAWRKALLADLAYEASLLPGRRLTSIFFGGGTPSLMDPTTVEAIKSGAEDASVAQFPAKMGELGIDTVVKAIRGEAVEANVDTGAGLVTLQNVKDFE